VRCLEIAAADQDCFSAAGRSMRGTSSMLKGAVSARHVQKSVASFSIESCARIAGAKQIAEKPTAKIARQMAFRTKLPSPRCVKECASLSDKLNVVNAVGESGGAARRSATCDLRRYGPQPAI